MTPHQPHLSVPRKSVIPTTLYCQSLQHLCNVSHLVHLLGMILFIILRPQVHQFQFISDLWYLIIFMPTNSNLSICYNLVSFCPSSVSGPSPYTCSKRRFQVIGIPVVTTVNSTLPLHRITIRFLILQLLFITAWCNHFSKNQAGVCATKYKLLFLTSLKMLLQLHLVCFIPTVHRPSLPCYYLILHLH